MSLSDKGLLLHVGLPKTGTTTLQRALFACHSDIYYLGKVVKHNTTTKRCLNRGIYNILKNILWHVHRPMNPQAFKKQLQETLFDAATPEQVLVGSWEELGNRTTATHKRMLTRIVSVFGNCRIMYVLRNPLHQLPSEYLQDLKGHFIKFEHLWMGTRCYLEIETWFARKKNLLTSHTILNYANCIRASVDLLGEENVGVFLFEDLLENANDYYRSICDFIGIESEQALALCESSHFHPRISQGQINFLKEVNSSFLKKAAYVRMTRQQRRRHFFENDDHQPARAVLNARCSMEVAEKTCAGHRWLTDRFNLPLARYDYPL